MSRWGVLGNFFGVIVGNLISNIGFFKINKALGNFIPNLTQLEIEHVEDWSMFPFITRKLKKQKKV